MLKKLGGSRGNIDILQIEIRKWYKSSRSMIQIIDNGLINRQPFQQITILYQCNELQTMERLVLVKYLKYQERSSCPTQIYIISKDDFLISNNLTVNKSTNIRFNQNIYINKTNLTFLSFNRSNFYYNKKKKPNQWNLFAKVLFFFTNFNFYIFLFFDLDRYCTHPNCINYRFCSILLYLFTFSIYKE